MGSPQGGPWASPWAMAQVLSTPPIGAPLLQNLMKSLLPLQKNPWGMPDTHPKNHLFIHFRNQHCPIQSQLQSLLGVHSSYVECNYLRDT